MIRKDEDALICDFAETYHIYDYRGLSTKLAASLAVGLRDDSRIKMQFSGAKAPTEILLLAAAVDRLSLLVWAQTKDAEKGRNRPASILESFNPREKNESVFDSGEDYEKERERLLNQSERR